MYGHIRWMIKRDMPSVMEIERASFSEPWLEKDFIKCLRTRNCIGMVCERFESETDYTQAACANTYIDVAGFMVYELNKRYFNILNFAVNPAFRRQGVGTAMFNKIANKLSPERRIRLHADVRVDNLDAAAFFLKMGCRQVGILEGKYLYEDGSREDARELRYLSLGNVSSFEGKTADK